MRELRPCVRWVVLLMGSLMTRSGCTYAAMQKLSLDEQAELHLYQKVTTPSQARASLAKATAAARTASRSEIGLAQRFQALDPSDREAVRSGLPRVGMRAEAVLFLWGEPYYTAGDASRYAHWSYLGSSLGLADDGNRAYYAGHRVDVARVAGQVTGWVDSMPSDRPRKRSMPCALADRASCGPVC
jgi:hypothetical protein